METCTKYEAYSEPVINRNRLIQRLLEMPEEIAEAEEDILRCMQRVEKTKEEMLDKEMALIRDGKIEGKNETERRANIRNLTAIERTNVSVAENDLAAYKIQFNRKMNEFSALKAVARLISKEAE